MFKKQFCHNYCQKDFYKEKQVVVRQKTSKKRNFEIRLIDLRRRTIQTIELNFNDFQYAYFASVRARIVLVYTILYTNMI